MSKSELWKPIIGFEQKYEISNQGRVYSKIRYKVLKPTTQTNGYNYVTLSYGNGDTKKCRVHRLVATHFLKNPENKPLVHHKNHVKVDNRVSNLMFATGKENIAFAFEANVCKKSDYGSVIDGFSFKDQQKQYYQQNKQNKLDYQNQYYQQNKAKILAQKKQNYQLKKQYRLKKRQPDELPLYGFYNPRNKPN